MLLLCAALALGLHAPPNACVSRRDAVFRQAATAASFLAASSPLRLDAADRVDSSAAQQLRDTQRELADLLENKERFIAALADGDATVKLPQQVPFATFQKLEPSAGPMFMEAAIDYAEAARNARDLYKLAKLTKQKVRMC